MVLTIIPEVIALIYDVLKRKLEMCVPDAVCATLICGDVQCVLMAKQKLNTQVMAAKDNKIV